MHYLLFTLQPHALSHLSVIEECAACTNVQKHGISPEPEMPDFGSGSVHVRRDRRRLPPVQYLASTSIQLSC